MQNRPWRNERYGRRVQVPSRVSFVSMILLERGGKEDATMEVDLMLPAGKNSRIG